MAYPSGGDGAVHAHDPMAPGDTVWIAPHEEHWHGAAPASLTLHLAVYEAETDGTTTVWLEQVTEADYTAFAEDD
jgi:hypothetical protein